MTDNCVRLEGTGDLNHYNCLERFITGCPNTSYTDDNIYESKYEFNHWIIVCNSFPFCGLETFERNKRKKYLFQFIEDRKFLTKYKHQEDCFSTIWLICKWNNHYTGI